MSFSGHPRGSSEYRRLIIGLFFAGVATFTELYAPQAVLRQLAADLADDPASAALSVSAATLGVAVAVVPWSIAADRIGRVPAMAIGLLSAAVLALIAPLSGEITLFLVLRLAEGIALGAVPAVALVYLSEEVDVAHAAAAAGSYISGTTVGGLVGRIVSGYVGELWGWRAGLWVAALVCVVTAALFLALVPRARGFVPGRMRGIAGPPFIARLWSSVRSVRQLTLYAMGFLLMGSFVAVYNYLGFHLVAEPFGLPVWIVTLLFLAYLAGTFSSPWAGRIATRVGRYPVLLGAIGVMAIGAATMSAKSAIPVLAGLLLFTAGFFGAHAIASGWVPVAASAESRAQASSLYYLCYYGGSSLFGWALGLVFAGAGWLWFVSAVVVMCAGAIVLAVLTLRREPTGRV